MQSMADTSETSALRRPQSWTLVDSVILVMLLLISLICVVTVIRWHDLPAEDALMLLRYAQHLVSGQGITWNVGERPVEGATDFLFLVMLSAWIKLSHLAPIVAGRTLLAAMHLGSVAWLYAASRKLFGTNPAMAAALALYLATGPGLLHASNDFSPTFYALAALMAWSFACSTAVSGETTRKSILFALTALIAGLIRPDGVLLAIFMAVALLYYLRGKAGRILLITAAIFLLLGGSYFAWRFHYFGYLLPNPFYKKGGGHLHPESIRLSVSAIFKMLLPTLPVFVVGLLAPRARRRAIFALMPIVLFALVWVLLTPENDVNMRFQYVTLPLGLLSVPMILNGLRGETEVHGWLLLTPLPGRRRHVSQPLTMFLAAAVLCTIPMDAAWWRAIYPGDPVGSGNYNIARGLAAFEDKHYTLLVTEAGVIPYFSRWRTIDAWGLNDATIVHDPRGLTEEYLERNKPAVIMFFLAPNTVTNRADFDRVWRGDAATRQDIEHLMPVMGHYATTHNYELAARWGVTPCRVHVWYVRRDLPETAAFMALVQTSPHFFSYGGELATNYLDKDPPTRCDNPAVSVNLQQ